MSQKLLLAVIHHLDHDTSIAEAQVAFNAGADGVFLISHDEKDDELFAPAMEIKRLHPDTMVGLNLLTFDAKAALDKALDLGLDMVWADDPGVRSDLVTDQAREIGAWLADHGQTMLFFASVAFKYQPAEPNPALAAENAASLHMIPTTSGTATGVPPEVEKIESMRKAIGNAYPLALASGLTPENIKDYAPLVTHCLVSTGISLDEHHFDPERVKAFAARLKRQ